MKNQHLTQALRERGVAQAQIRELFFYYLNSKDRQLTMLEWLESEPEANEEKVFQKAREILRGYLSTNPYNAAAKNMPLPKWTAPIEETAPARPEKNLEQPVPPKDEIEPFDKVLQAFFQWE